jgi:peptide deformylase
MSVIKIVQKGEKILEEKTEKVKAFDEEVSKIIKDLTDTAINQKDPEAAGLAAPQIGYNKRICIVRNFIPVKDSDSFLIQNTVMINPKIISMSKEQEVEWESCLSIPSMYGKVLRPKSIKVLYQDEKGIDKKIKANGFFARVIQHEIDHLDGILFTNKVLGNLITEEEYNSMFEND